MNTPYCFLMCENYCSQGKRSCCTAKARNTVRMQLKLLKKEDWLAFAEARELKLLLHYEVGLATFSIQKLFSITVSSMLIGVKPG